MKKIKSIILLFLLSYIGYGQSITVSTELYTPPGGSNYFLDDITIAPGANVESDGDFGSASFIENKGAILGSGNIFVGTYMTNTGTVSPGSVELAINPAVLTFYGPYTNGTGALNIELNGTIAGTGHDQLKVLDNTETPSLGVANLGGILNVSFLGAYLPSAGDSYTILTAVGGVIGTFSTVNLPAVPGLCPSITYNANSVVVTYNLVVTAAISNSNGLTLFCPNTTTTLTASGTGGTGGPYTYLWAPGGAVTASIVASAAGMYTVTVSDANGCSDTETVTVNFTSHDIAVIASGPGTLNFNPTQITVGQTSLVHFKVKNISTDAYAYTFPAPAGHSLKVTYSLPLGLGYVYDNSIVATGGNFSWVYNPPTMSQPYGTVVGTLINTLTAGEEEDVTIQVIGNIAESNDQSNVNIVSIGYDNCGDNDISNGKIHVIENFVVSVANDALCFGGNGSVTLTPDAFANATPPYAYAYTGTSSGSGSIPTNAAVTVPGFAVGSYTFTFTDALGAMFTAAPITIGQPTAVSVSETLLSHVNNTCDGAAEGSFTVIGSGGTPGYTYAIAGPTVNATGLNSGVFTSLLAGSYIVTATDANGCTGTTSVTITQPNVRPDLSPNIPSPLNTTFLSEGVSQEGYVQVSNVKPSPTTGTVRFSISKVANFNISLGISGVSNPGDLEPDGLFDGETVSNTDFTFTEVGAVYEFVSKPGVVIPCNSNIKIGFIIQPVGIPSSFGIMTVTVQNGTGGSLPTNGDDGNFNNQAVKIFSIN